ncbi:MAG: LytTR family DNA-binding domain-containing protein [Chitinophagaceae bacterium]
MTIKCIVTDDEPFARKGLQGYIEQIDFLDLKGICEDALQLNAMVKQQAVDLLFLDIEMPYITGIDFLKNLPNSPKVIFTTAYEKYAVQGFELDILDYLLKPISFERFLKATNKAYEYFQGQQSSSVGQDYIFVKSDNKLEKITFTSIVFIEALENYISIQTTDRKILTHLTLTSIREILPASLFIQPHKSFIVAIDSINSIEGHILHINKFKIPISRYQRDVLMERIVNNKLLRR